MSFVSTVAFGLMAGAAVGFLAKRARESVVTLDALPPLEDERLLAEDAHARFTYLQPSRHTERAQNIAPDLRPCVVRVTDRRIVVAQAQPLQPKMVVVRYVAHRVADETATLEGVERLPITAVRSLEHDPSRPPLLVLDADAHGPALALETSAAPTILERFAEAR